MGLVSYWAHRVLEFWQSVEATRFTDLARDVLRAERAMWLERRVIVIGAPGSGKSSLVAGLLGSELPLRAPMARSCVRWRFACSDGDVSDSRFLPKEELEGIEVVDTADCADPACAARIEELFDRTDVLIAALDCRRMDESPCWPLLQKAEDSVGAVILAITFMDQVGREELLRIKGSIRKLCHERLHGHPVALLGFALLLTFIGFAFTLCWSAFGAAFQRFFSRRARLVNWVMALLLVYCALSLFLA